MQSIYVSVSCEFLFSLTSFLGLCQKGAKLAQSSISTYASSVFSEREGSLGYPAQTKRATECCLSVCLNGSAASRGCVLSLQQLRFEMNYGQSLPELIV